MMNPNTYWCSANPQNKHKNNTNRIYPQSFRTHGYYHTFGIGSCWFCFAWQDVVEVMINFECSRIKSLSFHWTQLQENVLQPSPWAIAWLNRKSHLWVNINIEWGAVNVCNWRQSMVARLCLKKPGILLKIHQFAKANFPLCDSIMTKVSWW